MQEASVPTPQPNQDGVVVPPAAIAAAGLDSVSRRRTLLKGVGKAGALAGAALPLRGLATGDKPGMRLVKDGKNYLCSVSGNNSLTHASHAASSVSCSAKSVSFYQNTSNWPRSAANTPICIVGGSTFDPTKRFSDVFGSGSSTTLLGLLQARSPGNEAHWLVAMLNATKMSPTFPYSTTEVKALYTNVATRDAALSFFRDNLEA